YEELYRARNFKPWMSKGLYSGSLMVGIDQIVLRGKAPWTLRHHQADHQTLKSKDSVQPIAYPRPDGVLSFDRLSSVFISNTNHNEDQPVHLTLKDPSVPLQNLQIYAGPEQRYCLAGVYEFVDLETAPRLQLDALDFPSAAKTVYAVFRIISAIALIRLFGFGVFRLLLPLLGRDLPRIIEDLAIVVAYVVYGFVQLRGAGVDLSSLITTSAILTA